MNSRNPKKIFKQAQAAKANGDNNVAISLFQQLTTHRDKNIAASANFNIGNILFSSGSYDSAEQFLNHACSLKENSDNYHYHYARALQFQGNYNIAESELLKALSINPNNAKAKWALVRLFPLLYNNKEEIIKHRKIYAKRLQQLSDNLQLSNATQVKNTFEGITSSNNFFLQYQGCDDKELQEIYGKVCHKVVNRYYKNLTYKTPPAKTHHRIRIAYCSTFLRDHNGANWLLGWLKDANHEKFEIYCYHTGSKTDGKTTLFKDYADHYHHIPADLLRTAKQIIKDEIDILIHPEIGMDAFNSTLACLRLAPTQCVGWGHPITTGIPTIDYWLSCESMEPDGYKNHYTEQVFKLPNIGNCYSKDKLHVVEILTAPKARNHFRLPDNKFLFLCSQSLIKYLPQHDYLFVKIAQKAPDCKFVFLAFSSTNVVQQFMKRLDSAFKVNGLNAGEFCIMLNRQSEADYLSLNLCCDAFLDNPSWSGNNTTLTAIDCSLPIVTLPTSLMRGRHTFGILKFIDATETICNTDDEYIEKAARLANDHTYYNTVKQLLINKRENLYDDKTVVKSLEDFYESIYSEKPDPLSQQKDYR